MDDARGDSAQLQCRLDRLRIGDDSAREELIGRSCERLRRLTRRMLRGYPGVRRWEQTDDVLQNALLRLHRSLAECRPATPRDFFALAAATVRRELIDLARRHSGPEGHGANHGSDGADGRPPLDRAGDTDGPAGLLEWGEFHEQVEGLPEPEREVFDLLWYGALTQAEAAAVLGVAERTVKRRWRSARVALYQALGGEPPGE